MPLVSCPALADSQAEQECRAQYYNDLDAAYGDAGRKQTAEEDYKKCLRDIENKETISVRGQRSPSYTIQYGMFFSPNYGNYISTNSMSAPTSSGGSYLSTEDQDKAKEDLCEEAKIDAETIYAKCELDAQKEFTRKLESECIGQPSTSYSLNFQGGYRRTNFGFQYSSSVDHYTQCRDRINADRETASDQCTFGKAKNIANVCG